MPHNNFDNHHNSGMVTSSKRQPSRWLKNASALGVTTVLSAGLLLACG